MDIIRNKKQLKQASAIFAEAFQDYPLYTYVFPNKKKRMRLLPIFFECAAEYVAEYAYCHTENGQVQAVMLLDSPAHMYPTLQEIMSIIFRYSFRFPLRRSTKLLGIFKEYAKSHPPVTHYYIQTIAVKPDHQGRGLGNKCIDFARDLATENALFLETNSPSNVGFYTNAGFQQYRNFKCDHGKGPEMWSFVLEH